MNHLAPLLAASVLIFIALPGAAPAGQCGGTLSCAGGIFDCAGSVGGQIGCSSGETAWVWEVSTAVADELESSLSIVDASAPVDLASKIIAHQSYPRREDCTNGLRNQDLCEDTANEVISFAWVSAASLDIASELAIYSTDTIICRDEPVEVYSYLGSHIVVSETLNPVATSDCLLAQVGESISSPLSDEQRAWRLVRDTWRDLIVRTRSVTAQGEVNGSVEIGE